MIKYAKQSLVLAVLIFIFIPILAAADVSVRIYSKYDIQDVTVYNAQNKEEKCRLIFKNGFINISNQGKNTKKISSITLFNGLKRQYVVETYGQSRVILGKITASIMDGEKGIVLVSIMEMEDYVPCVLSSEMDSAQYKLELAKAFAITIRTFATKNNKRHKNYDFCDLTHCEVFKGIPPAKDKWYKPVMETKNMTLSGSCAKDEVYFSACCGGITENAGEFTSGKAGTCGLSKSDNLNGVNLCVGHRYYRWKKYINKSEIENALCEFTNEKEIKVKDVRVSVKTASGRVKQLDFTYESDGQDRHISLDVNKYLSVFGKKSGWALIPSKFFDIKKEGEMFVLNGRGHGHGVGLCLQGAYTLDCMGKSYEEILKFYFPNLSIKR